MVLRLSLYSSQSLWWHSDYPYAHHSLPIGSDNPYTHQSPWLYSDFTFTHHSLSGGPQTIPILITVYLVAQTISILITVSLVVLRLSLYSSQTPWRYSDYTYTHDSLSGGPRTIPILITIYLVSQTISSLITVSLVVLRLSLYSSQSPLWYSDYPFFSSQSLWLYSDYPYTHHSESSCWSSVYPYPHHILFGGTQTQPIRIIVSLVVLGISPYSPQSTWWLRQSLYSSPSLSWYPDYPFTHHSLPGGSQTIHILIIFSLVVLRLSLYSSQSPW